VLLNIINIYTVYIYVFKKNILYGKENDVSLLLQIKLSLSPLVVNQENKRI